MITFRPDQAKLDGEIDAAYDAGARNVLAVLPTGGGKSIIVSKRTGRLDALGKIHLIGAHRNELVGQMSMHVAREGVRHRIIASASTVSQIVAEHRREFNGQSFINPDARCCVSSFQTIAARAEQLRAFLLQVDHWTGDEAHHMLRENLWGRAIALMPNATGLGVTASPRRADGMGLGRHHDGLFDDMVVGPDMRSLIDIGALCDYEIAGPPSDFHISDDDITPGGDFSPKKMHEASKKSHLVGDVVKEYVKRAYGKRGICFAIDVEDSNEIARRFNDIGIPAASVSAKTPKETRNEYIRRFRNGHIWMLVNVDLFGEGFDVPAVEVVIMARPTASLAVYLQQFGRALRTLAGKSYGLVIDHVSNYKRHGFPDKAHYWSLDRRDKKSKKVKDPEEIELRPCSGCSRPYERVLTACPHCGLEPPLPAPGGRTIELVDGDLELLDRETLAAMRVASVLESPASVGERVLHAAGPIAARGAVNASTERHAAQARLIATLNQWAGCELARGRSERESHKRFWQTVGMTVPEALALPRADMDAMSARVEGWYLT